MKNLSCLVLVVLYCQIRSFGQVSGSDTVCPGYSYTYSALIPGSSSFQWTFPSGWYVLSGQGTNTVQLYCNAAVGQVCATGFDTSGIQTGQFCKTVVWGGGGGGWDAVANPTGPCPQHPWSISIVPNGTGSNCGGCGSGSLSPSALLAVYDNPWPSGAFAGWADGTGSFFGGFTGATFYVYLVDTMFGLTNAFLISGGACSATINNAVYVPPGTPPMIQLYQSPNPVCIGDTVTVSDQNGNWSTYNWSILSGSATFVSPSYDPAPQLIVNGPNPWISVVLYDLFGCYYYGDIILNTTTCFTGCEIAHFPFHGNAQDSTANNIAAVVTGAQLADDRFGIPNETYQFDGVNDRIDFQVSFDFPERSILFWFYADTIDANYRTLYSDNHGTLNYGSTYAYVKQTAGMDSLYMQIGTLGNFVVPVTEKQWVHVAMVKGQTQMNFYVNGCLQGTITAPNNNSGTTGVTHAVMGTDNNYINTRYFKGRTDDVHVYQCALSDSAVEALAGTGCAQFVPQAMLSASDTSFCDKKYIDFTDLSTNNPTSWFWLFPGATPNASNAQHPAGIYYASQGNFDVTLISCNAFGCDTLYLPGFIQEFPPAPVPGIVIGNDTLYSTPAAGYQWYLNFSPIGGATDPYYVFQQSGAYYVVITDSNGCQAAAPAIVIDGLEGLPTAGWQVRAVGGEETLTLLFDQAAGSRRSFTVRIKDMAGREIIRPREETITGPGIMHLPVNRISRGIYCISIQEQSRVKTIRWAH